MAEALTIRMLGPLSMERGGKALACGSRKALWMAAYVLQGGVPQPRTRLAALLWGAAPPAKALGSLRVALTKLPPAVLSALEVRRDTIAPSKAVRIESDVDRFVADCARADADSLERAVEAYRGDFLEGVDGEEAPEFFDWVFGERTRLKALAHEAQLACAQARRARGDATGARSLVDAWLAREPADEGMHRLLMTWLAKDAGADRALAQFDAYRRALAVTAGATPTAAMAQLAERLGQRASAPPPPARLAAGTSFLGREADLDTLADRLRDPDCRLVTLHGMGGVGKTRLALALAERMEDAFGDGTFVVALDEVASASRFAQAVASACGLQPAGAARPRDLLAAYFRRRQALVVLDNLEHLIAHGEDPSIAAQVAELLAGTGSRFKLLATSREPLGLQEEWVHEVRGLDYPHDGAADARESAAVRLFVQRARQVHAGFSLPAHGEEVARICATVEGLPLGIELAAGWMGSVTPADLLAGLRERAASLESPHANRAGRHRSLGAVVAYSWDRLTEEPRQALMGISVLSGSFPSEAAGRIASASPAVLGSLADKSLLARAGDGRWHLHEVVRQFAWEACCATASRRDTVIQRRDAFYLGWLREIAPRLDGPEEADALASIDRESANLREAWASAAKAGRLHALAAAAPAWFDFLEGRSLNDEGIAAATAWMQAARESGDRLALAHAAYYLGLFQRFCAMNAEALATLEGALAEARSEPLLASRIHAAKAFALLLLGRLDEAEGAAKDALGHAERTGDATACASACRVLGLARLQASRREEGRDCERRALAYAQQVGRPSLVAAAYNNLALAENHLGNHVAAEAGYRAALENWRAIGSTVNVGRGLHNLGVVATRQGEHATALERYREALGHLRKAGDRNLIALNLMSTGDALLRLGHADEAREPCRQALEMAERDGHVLPALDARIVLAQAAIELGEPAEAARHLLIVLDSAGERRYAHVLADAVVSAARLCLQVKPAMRETVLGWARAIAVAPEVTIAIRRDAEALLAACGEAPHAAEPAPREVAALAAEARGALEDLA
ncbi:MAG: tetratricopeptide repeat protein [Betaproteobacteria bacterium]|nr:tetratricopeptide repeat protein [Betaproteobacteria bacterium]